MKKIFKVKYILSLIIILLIITLSYSDNNNVLKINKKATELQTKSNNVDFLENQIKNQNTKLDSIITDKLNLK